MSGTPRLKGRRLIRTVEHFRSGGSTSLPDQTQPEVSNHLLGYDIGNVQERTSGCEASPLLYNLRVNQVYKGTSLQSDEPKARCVASFLTE